MKENFPLLSIVTPTFNEEENINELYSRVKLAVKKLKKYKFEFIFIDNASTDNTIPLLRKISAKDKNVKVIINNRNFGHIRSPYYGILQSKGEATIYLASDLQDPPELISEFIKEWERGNNLVLAIKSYSEGSKLMHALRKLYYRMLGKISDVSIVNDSTGFGLYDKKIINQLRNLDEPYPFLRGLLCELGYEPKKIIFKQAKRIGGLTKNNFYTLYDIGMLGIINHSKVPIRLAAFLGFIIGFLSMFIGIIFIILKLLYWNSFPLGTAPLIIGIFFLIGLLLFFLGVIGEYIGSIHNYLQKRPLVVEKERINFKKNENIYEK
jgi:glycosyltransferase involved in cell wall biosynthesis